MSLQKESEWENRFDKQFPPTIVKKEFVDALNEVLGTVGKYVPETATEIVIAQNAENARLRVKAFIQELLSNREKEIAEEVEGSVYAAFFSEAGQDAFDFEEFDNWRKNVLPGIILKH